MIFSKKNEIEVKIQKVSLLNNILKIWQGSRNSISILKYQFGYSPTHSSFVRLERDVGRGVQIIGLSNIDESSGFTLNTINFFLVLRIINWKS